MADLDSSDDVFDVLISDHRALLDDVSAAATTDDRELLPSRCEQLVMTVVRHFVAEEQYLLPLVRHTLADGEAASDAAFDEHRSVEDRLRKLEDVEHSPEAARAILDDVAVSLRHHVSSQQDGLFPELRSRCTAEQLRALAEEVLGSEQLAPTRPRIVRPESAPVNKLVSLVAGYVDHVRDAYSHRGTRHGPESAD